MVSFPSKLMPWPVSIRPPRDLAPVGPAAISPLEEGTGTFWLGNLKLIVWTTVSPLLVPTELALVAVISTCTVPEKVMSFPVMSISPVGGTDSGGDPWFPGFLLPCGECSQIP